MQNHVGAFKLIKRYGKGRDGVVYEAENDQKQIVAIKIATSTETIQSLKNEFAALQTLENYYVGLYHTKSPYFCHSQGPLVYIKNKCILPMELGGMNLSDLRKKEKSLFFEETHNIGCEMLYCIEETHNAGLLHGDLKLSNFVMANPPLWPNHVHLIDFGQGQSVKDSSAKSRGTTMFCSANVHSGGKYTIFDDLSSFLYLFLFMSTSLCAWKKEIGAICDLKLRRKAAYNKKVEFNAAIRGMSGYTWAKFNEWLKEQTRPNTDDTQKHTWPYNDKDYLLPLQFKKMAINLYKWQLRKEKPNYAELRSLILSMTLSCNYTYNTRESVIIHQCMIIFIQAISLFTTH